MSVVLSDLLTPDSPAEPPRDVLAAEMNRVLREARAAQPVWSAAPLRHRLKVLRRLRHRLAARPDDFTFAVSLPHRRSEAETLAGEILPLADACKWLEREAPGLLAPRRLPRRGRPLWHQGVRVSERRDPFGVVLIRAAEGEPLFGPGVRVAQALAAGNSVLLQPGPGNSPAALLLRDTLIDCGLDPRLLHVLHESPAAMECTLETGVDKLSFHGAGSEARAQLGMHMKLTPADLDLCGCDALFVRGDADLDLVVTAVAFALTFDGGLHPGAPRRLFAHRSLAAELESRLAVALMEHENATPLRADVAAPLEVLLADALARGARQITGTIEPGPDGFCVRPILLAGVSPDSGLLKSVLAVPVLSLISVASDEEALLLDGRCPFARGAAVFGRPEAAAELAAKIDAGCVLVNDLIVPAADPRVSLPSRRASGHGVTGGAAGLLAFTRPKTIVEQTAAARLLPRPRSDDDLELLRHYLAAAHGRNWRDRVRAAFAFLRGAYRRRDMASG